MKILAPLIAIYGFLLFWTMHPGESLFMAPHVSKTINGISKNYYLENSRCLQYFKFLGDVYVYNYYTPRILKSTKTSIRHVPCSTKEIPFHNHPYQDIQNPKLQEYYQTTTGDSLTSRNQMVYMSYADMRFAYYGGYKYVIVGSNGHWAWWSRSQIARAGARGVRLLKPLPNQSTL